MDLHNKTTLAATARTMAQSMSMVQHGGHTYLPMHYETRNPGPCDAEHMVWIPLKREDKRKLANNMGKVLFAFDSEITSFDLMLRQWADQIDHPEPRLLVKTEDGLRALDEEGQLVIPDGSFLPNYIRPMLNEDPEDKLEVLNVIVEWLGSEEEAESLLNHLATSLAPGWSAVKYVLLLGDGRNGKSVLLKMIADLFGQENVSNITRQQMAEALPVITELNGKLLNVVYDGKMQYIRDSSMEKTLIAGEAAQVRMLYENGTTPVQTNALFIEALNNEPKSRDKSSALQKRLSRFWFPNTYPLNHKFEKHMRSERMLGAFLALLIDHFILSDELADKLKQTSISAAMQVEQQLINSPLLQYVNHMCQGDPKWIKLFEEGGLHLEPLIAGFMAWRLQEGHGEYSTADAQRLFKEQFLMSRKSVREGGTVRKKLILAEPKPEVQALLDQLRGEDDDGLQDGSLVED